MTPSRRRSVTNNQPEHNRRSAMHPTKGERMIAALAVLGVDDMDEPLICRPSGKPLSDQPIAPGDDPPGHWARKYIAAAEDGKAWLAKQAGDFLIPVTR